MNTFFILLVIVLTITNVNAQSAPNDQSTSPAMQMDHSHLPIAVPLNTTTPLLSLSLHNDTMSGYNLHLTLKNYHLIPPPNDAMSMSELMSASVNNKTGFVEGHAHLYINGIKIQRVYGINLHLPAHHFKEGINTISVTLNNHGHMYWTAEEKKVVATLFIDTLADQVIKHKFESFPAS